MRLESQNPRSAELGEQTVFHGIKVLLNRDDEKWFCNGSNLQWQYRSHPDPDELRKKLESQMNWRFLLNGEKYNFSRGQFILIA